MTFLTSMIPMDRFNNKTLIKVGELDKATIKQYLIVQNEGKRVNHN
jgi:hypothetical protein